tara:strand:+ start:31 stop:5229 length:5199 start_codon:yes stop_codon:yes gene_type:complete
MATNDSSFAYSIDQAQRLFGKGLEVIGSRTGIESLFNYGKEVVAQQDRDIKQGNYKPEYTMGLREAYQQGGLSDAIGWVAEKTGENIATSGIALGGGLASALTAPFSVPAAALIGGATILGSGIVGTGEVAEEMEQKTGSYNDSVAIGAGTIIALLDRFGAGRVIPKDELLTITGKELIKRLGEEGKVDAAREIGRRIGKSVAFEGGTEGLQEGVVVGSTALTGGEYTGEQVADRLLEGVVLGATMGGATTTGIEAFRQGPGIAGLIGDTLGPGGMPPAQQLAMQTAASLYGPSFAQYRAKDVPLSTAEILMNEAAGQGETGRTTQQKVDDNLSITDDTDPSIDEDQTFFSPDLEGGSVGNPSIQKIADEELKAIDDKLEQRRQSGESISPMRAKVERDKAKNRERFTDMEDPVVSPLRIKLIKLARDNKFGMKRPIKVSEVYDELRGQERRREGSVGFIGREQYGETTQDQIKYIPIKGKGQEFSKAVKAAPKVDGRPDFASIPNIDEIAVKTTVPKKIKRIATVFDSPNERGDLVIHNRGGEAFVSGLEEYLVRNKDTTKTMEEIIYDFDQMRPTVRLQVRSSLNRNMATGTPGSAPFTNFELAAGDVLQDPSLAAGTAESQQLESTQRIYESFATPTGKPINVEVPSGNVINIERNRDPEVSPLGSGQIFEIDSISVVAVNPDQEKLKGGSLTNSPLIKAVQQKQNAAGNTIEAAEDASGGKELNLPHDYYNKGFGYSRAMIVRGADNKLYAMLEELQSDVTRTYENLLDFAKPEYAYNTPLEYGGIPELFSGAIDMALKGNDPHLTKNAASLGGTTFQDRRPIRTLDSTYGDFTGRDNRDTYKILTPSERNKIRVLDAMDQDMPDSDAPSQFNEDLARRRKIFKESQDKLEIAEGELEKINTAISNFKSARTAPMEISKIQNVTLDDANALRPFLINQFKSKFANDKRLLERKRSTTGTARPTSTSLRARADEQLTYLESMLDQILFVDNEAKHFEESHIRMLESGDDLLQMLGTGGNAPEDANRRDFDGFQLDALSDKSIGPDRGAMHLQVAIEDRRSRLRTPLAKSEFSFNKQGRLVLANFVQDENNKFIQSLGFPFELSKEQGLVKLIHGHMPFRSKNQFGPGVRTSSNQESMDTSDNLESRRLNKNGIMYAHGKDEREFGGADSGESYFNTSEEHIKGLLKKNLQDKGYSDADIDIFLEDADDRSDRDLNQNQGMEQFQETGFRGDIQPDDLNDAIEKTLNSTIERSMNEAVNEQALNVIRNDLAAHLANKFRADLAQIDFDTIINNAGSEGPYTDSRFLPSWARHDYSKMMNDIENILPEKVKVEAEKELSRLIDRMKDKIGFVPEDGNYAAYREYLNLKGKSELAQETFKKFDKELGLTGKNADAMKKKLLMRSMLKNQKISTSDSRAANQTVEKDFVENSNLLGIFGRFKRGLEETSPFKKYYNYLQKSLQPVSYNENDFGGNNIGAPTGDPTMSSVYTLFLTDAYKSFLAGDKTRAEKIQKDKTRIEKQIPALKKLVEDNEVGLDNNDEIDRRFKKLIEHAEKNAKDYNYKPEELKEAATRLFEHINDNKRYTRSPHNATMAQTSRGLLQSLIHKVTDPRFEQLYGEPIAGIVVPHREDLWLPRANEDASLRGIKKTFGLGTYDNTLATVAKRFEDAGAEVDRDRIFEMLSKDNTKRAQLNRPAQFVINLAPGSKGRKLAEGKFTFRAKGGYIDLRRKAS